MDKKSSQLSHNNNTQYHAITGRSQNDCTVMAMSVVTGISYSVMEKKMSKMRLRTGRVHGHSYLNLLSELGFNTIIYDPQIIIDRFPGKHKNKKWLTSHSPDRFPKAWPPGVFLMNTRGHVLAIVDGVVHDWSRGRSLKCLTLTKITKGK